MRFLFLFIVASCAAKSPSHTLPLQPSDHTAIGKEVHKKINKVRRKHGLSALKWNADLTSIAQAHSLDMANRNYFAHVTPDGVDLQNRYRRADFNCQVPAGPRRFLTGGENLHKGWRRTGRVTYSDGRQEETGLLSIHDVAAIAVEGWMNSPGHRENILQPHWLTQGIGVWMAPDGAIYVTQNFC